MQKSVSRGALGRPPGAKLLLSLAIMATAALGLANTFQFPTSTSFNRTSLTTTNFTQIATGKNHSIGLDSSGNIWSWANNGSNAAIGRTTGTATTPTQLTVFHTSAGGNVTGATPTFSQIASGDDFCIALEATGANVGAVFFWGTLTGSTTQTVPTIVESGNGNKGPNVLISAGGTHGFYLEFKSSTTTYTLKAIGANTNGECLSSSAGPFAADGTTSGGDVSANISTLSTDPLVSIACGASHSLFVHTGGSVQGCGLNTSGQLGNNSIVTPAAGTAVTAVNSSNTSFTGATAASAGNNYSLLIGAAGAVFSAGDNSLNQLGRAAGSGVNRFGTTGLTGATQISAGFNFAMALTSSPAVFSWGLRPTATGHDTSRATAGTAPLQEPGYSGPTAVAANHFQFATSGTYTITNGGGYSAVSAAAADAILSTVTFGTSPVTGGNSSNITVTMDSNVVANTTISLSSNNVALSVPSTVTVLAGNSSVTSTNGATTTAVATDQNVTVTASQVSGGYTVTGSETVKAVNAQSVGLVPTTVVGGVANSTGTVTLDRAAPTGGISVTLNSSNTSAATVPASVNVTGGQTTATFTVTSVLRSTAGTSTITATLNGGAPTAVLTVNPINVTALTLNATKWAGGQTNITGTVTISNAAPTGGVTVNLSSDKPGVANVPATVTVAAGQTTSAPFAVSSTSQDTNQTVTFTADRGAGSASVQFVATVQPPKVSTLKFSASKTVGGKGTVVTGTVTLKVPAGSLGVDVVLTPSDAAVLNCPATCHVAAGSNSGTFTFTANAVPADISESITAAYRDGDDKTASINVLTATLVSISGAGNNKGGKAYTFKLSLNTIAAAGGAVVNLSSDDGVLTVPPTATIPAGQTFVTVTVTSSAVATTHVVTITATRGAITKTLVVNVNP
jgi:alpha-tubulin suppressor-like RCC1 family protein